MTRLLRVPAPGGPTCVADARPLLPLRKQGWSASENHWRRTGRRRTLTCMSQPADAKRFRSLPEPVRPDELVETVDVSSLPARDEETEDRERFLRSAGATCPAPSARRGRGPPPSRAAG